MAKTIQYFNDQIADFDLADWSIFKMAVFSFGILIGCSFSEKCRSIRPLLAAVWIAGLIYTVKRVFFDGGGSCLCGCGCDCGDDCDCDCDCGDDCDCDDECDCGCDCGDNCDCDDECDCGCDCAAEAK